MLIQQCWVGKLTLRPVSALPTKGEKGEKRARSSSIHAEVSAESHEPVSMGESSRGPSVSFDTRPPVIRRLTRASPAPVETEHQREPPRGAISMVESVLEQQAKRLFGTSRIGMSDSRYRDPRRSPARERVRCPSVASRSERDGPCSGRPISGTAGSSLDQYPFPRDSP